MSIRWWRRGKEDVDAGVGEGSDSGVVRGIGVGEQKCERKRTRAGWENEKEKEKAHMYVWQENLNPASQSINHFMRGKNNVQMKVKVGGGAGHCHSHILQKYSVKFKKSRIIFFSKNCKWINKSFPCFFLLHFIFLSSLPPTFFYQIHQFEHPYTIHSYIHILQTEYLHKYNRKEKQKKKETKAMPTSFYPFGVFFFFFCMFASIVLLFFLILNFSPNGMSIHTKPQTASLFTFLFPFPFPFPYRVNK